MEPQFSPIFFFLSILPILLLIMNLKTWKKSSKNYNPRSKLPPGPSKLPLIGNLHHFLGAPPHRCLSHLAKKYGPIMHLQLGEISTVVVSSPEVAEQVIKTYDFNFSNRPFSVASSLLTYNFSGISFTPYGDYWRQLRKICSMELLSPKRVQSFRAIREEEVYDFVREIGSKAGSQVNLEKGLFSMTYGIFSRVAFGVKYEEQHDFSLLVKESLHALGGFSLIDVFPSLKLLHAISGATSKLKKLHQKLDKILQNIIDEHRTRRAKSSSSQEDAKDLVDVLLNLRENGELGIPLTDSSIKAVILELFVAGTESSSMAIEWAMSEMLKNPRVLEKAQKEVRQVFGSKGEVKEKGLEELKYLKLVIKEVLRLHPVAPLIPRESRERCEINGYEIPPKTKLMVNVWAIARDPNYWTDANKFFPERFLDSSIDFKGANFEFIPFGAGRRICPGMGFGLANIELPLANLLYHFDWKFDGGIANLDMTEAFSLALRRKYDLCLVPTVYQPLNDYYPRKKSTIY